jgi:hypothetical protein
VDLEISESLRTAEGTNDRLHAFMPHGTSPERPFSRKRPRDSSADYSAASHVPSLREVVHPYKDTILDLLFDSAAQTLLQLAADPKRLGMRRCRLTNDLYVQLQGPLRDGR